MTPNDSPNARSTDSSVIRWARRLGVDRAVAFAVLARMWQLLTGPVTQLLIVFCFSVNQQGYYYAFLNLLAMQVFVELGLHVVLINVASHEWSGLRLEAGQIAGDVEKRSRLVSLGRTAVVWYSVAALVFVVAVSVAGVWFFEDTATQRTGVQDLEQTQAQPVSETATPIATLAGDSAPAVHWIAPWLGLVVFTGLQLALLPLTAILEGCGQLPTVNRLRFWQGIAGSCVVWILIVAGCGLWALAGSAAVRLLGELYLVAVRYRGFFEVFRRAPEAGLLSWKSEVLPLQWRIAIQGALLWLAAHLAGLVLFRRSETEAAQYGMMWTILAAMQAASLSWVETRRPLFGTLIAERRFAELDDSFFRLSRISILLMAAGGAAFSTGVWVVGNWSNWFFDRIAARLPDVKVAAILSLAMVVMHLAQCTNIYVRAHKRDPFLAASIVSNIAIASLVFWLGTNYGMSGVVLGYLAGVSIVQVPLWLSIWHVTRRDWHGVGTMENAGTGG
ncbi:MAG: hypothetical protein R3C19_22725 [Planctomycetaceae bacterium]